MSLENVLAGIVSGLIATIVYAAGIASWKWWRGRAEFSLQKVSDDRWQLRRLRRSEARQVDFVTVGGGPGAPFRYRLPDEQCDAETIDNNMKKGRTSQYAAFYAGYGYTVTWLDRRGRRKAVSLIPHEYGIVSYGLSRDVRSAIYTNRDLSESELRKKGHAAIAEGAAE